MEGGKQHVAVVESQPLLAQTIVSLLDASVDLDAAGSWTTYAGAAEQWGGVRPDAAIVDPSLLTPDPVSALIALQAGLDVPILLFSRRSDIDYVHLLLGAGARGLLGTAAGGEELLDATRAVSTSATSSRARRASRSRGGCSRASGRGTWRCRRASARWCATRRPG